MKIKEIIISIFFCLYSFTAGTIYADNDKLLNSIKNISEFEIDVSSLTKFYNTLPADEKEEQLRDWTIYGLISHLNIDRDNVTDILHEKFPLRLPYLKNVSYFQILPGRIEKVDSSNWIVVVSSEQLHDKNIISYIIDSKFVEVMQIPKNVHLFGYTKENDLSKLTVFYSTSIAGNILFSSEYGFFETQVNNINDLTNFFSNTNDLVYVSWKDSKLKLGGRKRFPETNRALTIDDIAVIYQAYEQQLKIFNNPQLRKEYEKFIQKKYKELVESNIDIKNQIIEGKTSPDKIYQQLRDKVPFSDNKNSDVNVGFSLDPQKDFQSLSKDIKLLAEYSPELGLPSENTDLKSVVSNYKQKLYYIVSELKSGNILPFLELRRQLVSYSEHKFKMFDDILRSLDQKNSYQSARYDGKLKGTSPGMILFYTDLVAKLWALDYNGIAPKNVISGFKTMPEFKIPKLYWEEFLKLSNTRLWFGLKSENYNINNKTLYFAPTVTRVYAASSNPLYPGKESEPNYQSAEFLGWWDRHYSVVADYEPQYYKLDQIQKWSCAFLVLKEENVKPVEFLNTVNTFHNYEFDKWYYANTELKSKTNIPFIDKNKYNRSTECLALMYSGLYPLMDQMFYISGGVSLASKKDLLSKLKKSEWTQVKTAKPGTKSKTPSKQTVEKVVVKEQKNIKYEFPQNNLSKDEVKVWKVVPKPGTKMRAQQIELSTAKQEVKLTTKQNMFLKLDYKLNNVPYGSFNSTNEPGKVVLSWTENEGCILNNFLSDIITKEEELKPDIPKIIEATANVEKIVPKIVNKLYYVKIFRPSKWIQLIINPVVFNKNTTVYCARASGTCVDSNIYEATFLSQQEVTNNSLQ